MEKLELMADDESEGLDLGGDKPVVVTMTFHRPEHEMELRQALNAFRYLSVLSELDHWLRGIIKHGEDATKADHYDEVRSRLHDLLEYEGVSLDECG